MAHNPPLTDTTPGINGPVGLEPAGQASSPSLASRFRGTIWPDSDDPGIDARRSSGSGFPERLGRLLSTLVVTAAAVVLVATVGLFGFRALYDGRIYPAVLVGDVPVGGLTLAAAEQDLAERAAALETGTVTFRYGDQVWTPTLTELGVTVDLAGSLAEARALGRSGDAATRLGQARALLQADQVVPLRTALDPGVLGAWFDGVDAALGQPAVNARVVVAGTTVTVVPEVAGVQVDRGAATAVITAALGSLDPVATTLPTETAVPAILASDLAEAQEYVSSVLGTNLRLSFENRTWRMSAESLAPYLTMETVLVDGAPQVQLAMDLPTLAADLRAKFGPEINRDPIDARVAWSTDSGLIALDPSRTGITVKSGDFARAVEAAFLGDEKDVTIPVVEVRPEIDDQNLAALKIETRLGQGDSNYDGGSWQRDENINVGVGLLNGTLVRPGEDFSFNQAIGAITPENGFVEASVVVAERVGSDYGGGICQVSTTVFRAALMAGMPIGEWHPHTYRLQNYERDGWGPGFDASILQLTTDPITGADFTFTNFTDGWLLVEAWTDWPYVIINIYGPETGNTVEIVNHWQSEPITNNEDVVIPTSDLPAGQRRQVEWPMNGLETSFVRMIFDANGEVVGERQFYSYFSGRGNVYEVGTG